MNPLKRNAVKFPQEVKIKKLVSNAANAKSRLAKKIQRNLLCVMVLLDLVKVECFKN